MLLANVGLPMIFVELPVLAAAFLPVVLIEATLFRWRLSVPWRESLSGTFRANLWSTFVGIPLAWFAQVVGQMVGGGGGIWELDSPLNRLASVTLQSAWLVPHPGEYDWMVPSAALCLLLPCLIVSIWVEQFALRRYWVTLSSTRLLRVTILGNVISYIMLAGYWGLHLFLSLHPRPAS